MPFKVSDVDILMVPGWTNSGPDHWQSRWERKLPRVGRIAQTDWDTPRLADWLPNIVAAVAAATGPVVLIAHSCGVSAVVHAAPLFAPGKVVGAYLVAPPDLEAALASRDAPGHWLADAGGFHSVPTAPLPFPSMLIASGNDPFVTIARAREMALDWGSDFADAGQSGHINTASGHGPWPEGLLKLGQFLKRLG
jgi:hypothetical protein